MAASTDVRTGRMAYERRAWREAYEAFGRAAAAASLEAEDLWRMALAASLIARDEEFHALLERAHDAHAAVGEHARAARCAFWLGFHLATRGEVGPASGWLARAARLVERAGVDCVEQGYLLVPLGHRRLVAGDAEAAYQAAGDAAAIAERFEDADLLALAIHLQGRARLRQHRLADGLTLLDEAMIDVASDRLSPHVTGLVYCSVIGACRSVYELRRAQEWTAALSHWCDAQPDLVAFSGECLAYRAEIMNLHGDWRGAIEEAGRITARTESGSAAAVAIGYYQQGEAHRLLGEYAAAEAAYREASRLGREPLPGLSLLRLAQGDAEAAAAALRRAVGEARDPLQRARLLPALCEVLLELGRIEESRSACAELEQIASEISTEALTTMVAYARGATLLEQGDAGDALLELRGALTGWQSLEAPYEVARTRAMIARACRALGDEEGAALELDAARAAVSSLGGDPALLPQPRGEDPDPATARSHGLTPREAEVLAVVATGKSNRAIARALGISEKTVARHLSNIFGKLGVSSRAAATAYAHEHELLSPPA